MNRALSKLIAAGMALTLLAAAVASPSEPLTLQPAAIEQRAEARFPATMRALGIKEGRVSLVLQLDDFGQVTDTFVLESTRQDFTKSALKSLATWSFQPAQCNGEAIASSLRIDLKFEVNRKLTWQTFQAPMETNITHAAAEETPVTAQSFGKLDAIPLPIVIVEPEAAEDGKATIEFYIDEMGNVRCPRLTGGTSLAFGKTMLDTVTQWKFEPPLADGIRTNTMVRQLFSYEDGRLTAHLAE